MRIPSGVVDQLLYFVAVDSTDFTTRETGLTGFTVYRSRNGGTATVYTTPTVAEPDATNMPGVYTLLLDEDMTIASGNDSEEVCLHITQASMAPVTRVFELYRAKITEGNTLDVNASGGAEVSSLQTDAITAAAIATDAVTEIQSGLATAAALTTVDGVVDAILVDTGTDIPASITSLASQLTTIDNFVDTEVAAILAAVDTEVAAIKAKTDLIPASIPTGDENADALLDRAAGVETGFTVRQTLRLMAAVLLGKASGMDTTTAIFRDLGDNKDRVTATVDSDGNRTSVTRDAT